MLTLRPGFASDLLVPFPGRLGRAIEISVACTIVMVVSMTYEIPETALSTYLIFFAAKGNSGLNIVMGAGYWGSDLPVLLPVQCKQARSRG